MPALEAAGEHRAAASRLAEASRALAPFASLSVEEFAAFLLRAEEYRRTGTVGVPGAADRAAEHLVQAVQRLATARQHWHSANAATELESARNALADSLHALAKTAGLTGTLKADSAWIGEQISSARIAPQLEAIRGLAARIAAPEDYASEEVRSGLTRLEAELSAADLKAIATTFGVKATAKASAAKVLTDVLTKLTGHKPAKPKAGGQKTTAAADPAVVDAHARRLADLIERAAGPDGLPDDEVNAEMARLKDLAKPALIAVVRAAGFEGVGASESVAALHLRVRNRLTVAKRARDRSEV